MMKQTVLKWTTSNGTKNNKGLNGRNWLHPPETLQKGHIAYLVKFLGSIEVDQPKGIEVVKEGIRKLKFNQQLKKSEGTKTARVEITISIDGVAVQDPKSKKNLSQYPLHRISYCADDKLDKKFFSFIAKEADSDKHTCYVFSSDKLAEEITLTIGQAFDLAYRRFLETSGKDLEMRKQLMLLQKKVQSLEDENSALKHRITQLGLLKDRADLDKYKKENGINDLILVNGTTNGFDDGKETPPPVPPREFEQKQHKDSGFVSPTSPDLISHSPLSPSVGTKLENLLLDTGSDFRFDSPSDDVFDPRGFSHEDGNVAHKNAANRPGKILASSDVTIPRLSPPPPVQVNGFHPPISSTVSATNQQLTDLFGQTPFVAPPPRTRPANHSNGSHHPTNHSNGVNPPANATGALLSPSGDPFGMGDFGHVPSALGAIELENAIGQLDQKLIEMRDGFQRGIAFGNDDFSLEALDPLYCK